MAWCRQATSHYLSQCWPRYVLQNGITRPQWVKFCHAVQVKVWFKPICYVSYYSVYSMFSSGWHFRPLQRRPTSGHSENRTLSHLRDLGHRRHRWPGCCVTFRTWGAWNRDQGSDREHRERPRSLHMEGTWCSQGLGGWHEVCRRFPPELCDADVPAGSLHGTRTALRLAGVSRAAQQWSYVFLALTHWPLGDFNFRLVIFKLTLVNDGWGIYYEIALRLMPLDLTDDKSTLVQVMAWCREATSHYLSQCWPISMSPNGVTRPQWVNPSNWPLSHYPHPQWGRKKMAATLQTTFPIMWWLMTWARFLSLAWGKVRLCWANHRASYFSNLACDWLSIVWDYSEPETENRPWWCEDPPHLQPWYRPGSLWIFWSPHQEE